MEMLMGKAPDNGLEREAQKKHWEELRWVVKGWRSATYWMGYGVPWSSF